MVNFPESPNSMGWVGLLLRIKSPKKKKIRKPFLLHKNLNIQMSTEMKLKARQVLLAATLYNSAQRCKKQQIWQIYLCYSFQSGTMYRVHACMHMYMHPTHR